QFLFANLWVSDSDALDRAVALPQAIRAVFHPPRVGQVAFHVDLAGQAFDSLIKIPPAQLPLKLRDQFVGPRPEHAPQRIVAEIAPDCGERLFCELVVYLREEARRLIRQTVNEARTPAVVTLLFEGDQPVAFEESQVPPHTDLRHFQLSGQALDAHRAVGFEQINNRAASLFEDIFYGGYSHEPIIEGAVGFCQLFGFQTPEARAPLWWFTNAYKVCDVTRRGVGGSTVRGAVAIGMYTS